LGCKNGGSTISHLASSQLVSRNPGTTLIFSGGTPHWRKILALKFEHSHSSSYFSSKGNHANGMRSVSNVVRSTLYVAAGSGLHSVGMQFVIVTSVAHLLRCNVLISALSRIVTPACELDHGISSARIGQPPAANDFKSDRPSSAYPLGSRKGERKRS